jgi:acetylornithine deacetylase
MSSSVLDYIDEDEILEMARRMQAFKSFSHHEEPCARDYAELLESLGFEVEFQESEPGRPNVIGRLRGSGGGPSLMFNSHMDIDPLALETEEGAFDFYVEDNMVMGHGLRNMKAALASMTAAAATLIRAQIPIKGDMILAAVVGELQGGIGTAHMIEQGVVPDYAIVPEPTMNNIRTMHVGNSQFLISTIGKSTWGGTLHLYDHVNAVTKMAKVIQALENMELSTPLHPEIVHAPRISISNIMGGFTRSYQLWRTGYVPDYCTVVFECRTVPGQTTEEIEADLWRTLKPLQEADPELEIEIEPPPAVYKEPWRGMIEMPPLYLPKDDPLVDIVHRHHVTVNGKEPDSIGYFDPGSYAGADSGHLQAAGAHVLNYGPSGHGDIRKYGKYGVRYDYIMDNARVLALCAEEILTSTFDQLPGNTLGN